ncbi:TRAP transporter substrate-binding protein [Bradyrhizobium archetypum]|uniref:TRAP transporter substrate-binding protein DctP n=1 Tax=Bradyrhizobium archetypum TaxID=2721160 RepID=A0A7Y4H8H4_9BRAD|nr:TRAP transporter substrate-binding protein DctP [Bradyrhizobium archetypum]NOJ48687.1 TRAP transporter substrate-binding protein DctP [Bradyrhizobium archetypum]
MNRRKLLTAAGAAVASTAVAAPAIAQSTPVLRWRLATSFPKSLDTLYGACEMFAKAIADLSDQKFQIGVFGPGEIVPAFQVFDAVTNNTVEMGNSASYYYIGKDLAFAFGTAVPFGLNTRQMNAWLAYGGGLDMLNELYATFGAVGFPFGNTTAQMGGWFRKEIKTLDDLKGLKFRVGGVAGQVLSRLGVVPQQIPPGDIYPALEKGTIDAAEWIGPYDDEKLGFLKIAPYYYYPGWWEGCANGFLYVNSAKWADLPKPYQSMVTIAAGQVAGDLTAKYDARNASAIKRLVAAGAQLRPFSSDILDASIKATNELFAEVSAKNPKLKALYESTIAFRNEQYRWHQVCEATYDTYMIRRIRA